MKILKYRDLPVEFIQALDNIRKARELKSEAETLENFGKEYIKNYINVTRRINIDDMEIGETVFIIETPKNEPQKVLLNIEAGKQNRFDQVNFQLKNPEAYKEFKKPMKVIFYNL